MDGFHVPSAPRTSSPARPLALVLALLLAACANPMPPSGGPVDREPPRLVEAVPDTNAVNVTGGVLRLTFSEAVNQQTLANALSIVPEPEGRPALSWRGRTVEIDLGTLRDSTTYVVTIDNAFRDARGVALTAPITFAFSTGPTLNTGRLEGVVRDPVTGAGVQGVDVYAYPARDSSAALPERPLYRTQSGADGHFAFQYLADVPLYVVALRDENRNRRRDADEAFAVPPVFSLTPDTVAVAAPWLLALPDTAAPAVERVRSYSSIRHALRLREPVAADDGDWTLRDASGAGVPILRRYRTAANPREVFFLTPPLGAGPYTLTCGAVADSAGNRLPGGTETLTPSAARDTFRLRFVDFVPADGLLRPGQEGSVRFSLPLPDSLREGLVAARASDSTETPLPLTTDDGTTYRFPVADTLEVIVHAERLGQPAPFTQVFAAPGPRDLGGIEGFVAAADATQVIVEVRGDDGFVAQVRAGADGRFHLPDLLPGAYHIRAFRDVNEDGRWNAGSLAPYRSAEPVRWAEAPVNVRARWDAVLPDTLRF